MTHETKRATIYFNAQIHKVLKLKALETGKSISDLVNDAVTHEFKEDQEDLHVFEARISEPTVSYEKMLKELKDNGKI
jgi:hypothetical protein